MWGWEFWGCGREPNHHGCRTGVAAPLDGAWENQETVPGGRWLAKGPRLLPQRFESVRFRQRDQVGAPQPLRPLVPQNGFLIDPPGVAVAAAGAVAGKANQPATKAQGLAARHAGAGGNPRRRDEVVGAVPQRFTFAGQHPQLPAGFGDQFVGAPFTPRDESGN